MERQRVKSFNDLKDGDKIISPIDNEVTGFRIDKYDGEQYLTSKNCAFPIWQFSPNDFYLYDGGKNVGEIDSEYINQLRNRPS